MNSAKIFLHVGCGPKCTGKTNKGFNTNRWSEICLDIDLSVSPDITGTMTDLSGVGAAFADEIFSRHIVSIFTLIKHLLRYRNSGVC